MAQKKIKKPARPYEVRTLHSAQWNKERLTEILLRMRKKKILVIGDVGIDRYTIGSVTRISPEAPVPVVLVQEEKLKLGLAANVADNIRALDAQPLLIGVLGRDRPAQDFRELLRLAQIRDSYLITDPSRRTALKERIVSDRQQIVRIDYESQHGIDSKLEKKLLSQFQKLLPSVDGVILEDYAKGILTPGLLQTVFKLAKQKGKQVFVDPNLRTPGAHYLHASVLTPNVHEAEELTGVEIKDQKSLAQAGFSLLKMTAGDHVLLTLGKEGMAIFTRNHSVIRLIPTYAREVYDVSGAGDTVIAVVTLSLVSGATIEEAAILGNLAAGIEVAKRGTATVSVKEIQVALDYFATVGI